VVLTLWFWITPIFINIGQIPPKYSFPRLLMRVNPMTYLVTAYRDRLLTTAPLDLGALAVLAAYAAATFVIGGLFFRHLRRGFADVL